MTVVVAVDNVVLVVPKSIGFRNYDPLSNTKTVINIY